MDILNSKTTRDNLEQIRTDFTTLTEQVLGKSMKHANKQLQDTLMNYFLENDISQILKAPMNVTSKRAVMEIVQQNVPNHHNFKYINLLNAFEDKILEYNKKDDLNNVLIELINKENKYDFKTDQWKTHCRKRIISVMIIFHFNHPNRQQQFADFFTIWENIYPNNKLPRREPKQSKPTKPQVKKDKLKTTKKGTGNKNNDHNPIMKLEPDTISQNSAKPLINDEVFKILKDLVCQTQPTLNFFPNINGINAINSSLQSQLNQPNLPIINFNLPNSLQNLNNINNADNSQKENNQTLENKKGQATLPNNGIDFSLFNQYNPLNLLNNSLLGNLNNANLPKKQNLVTLIQNSPVIKKEEEDQKKQFPPNSTQDIININNKTEEKSEDENIEPKQEDIIQQDNNSFCQSNEQNKQ